MSCYQELCFKTGTRVQNFEALAACVSRVTGLDVRNKQITMSGQVKVRGPIVGYRKGTALAAPTAMESQNARASRGPRETLQGEWRGRPGFSDKTCKGAHARVAGRRAHAHAPEKRKTSSGRGAIQASLGVASGSIPADLAHGARGSKKTTRGTPA